MTLEELITQLTSYHPNAELDLINQAFAFASRAHEGQKRKSGEDYIIHPLSVAYILAQLQLDVATITAGLLHDVVEDTSATLEELEDLFGKEIAMLVDGVTKISRIEYKSQEDQQVENLRKMLLAMAKDIRVILIKLADRLHNMRTLKHQGEGKQKEVATETLEIFAPLAHRLGIFRLKWELEDLALRYLAPDKYYELVENISMKRQEREEYINQVIDILRQKIEELGIHVNIEGRPKHFYSIYNKMTKQGKELNEIYDLIAVRIIVDSVKDCYATLGVIHTLWKPIPGRFKDYIAMPKPNMYQSLHTTVVGPSGDPFEVQIRTWEMHRISEYGIAAHWKYKEGKAGDKEFDKKLSWMRQLLEWQRELGDAREFVNTLKTDIFSDRVYIFTPRGDVVELPAGSVPIDFAYKIHTAVGHNCVGAKVNGKIVPLDYQINTGDIVEILTSKTGKPSRDWLKIVTTSQAKNRIRQWFKKEHRDDNIQKGRELLEKEAKKQNLDGEYLKNQYVSNIAKKYNLTSAEDLYALLGEGGFFTPLQIVAKLKENVISKENEELESIPVTVKPWVGYGKPSQGIRVKGLENVMVRLSRCCNPLPGDEIIGYITRGRGVSVHRNDCPNFIHHLNDEFERIIEVAWDTQSQAEYQVHIEVVAMDRPKLAMDVIKTLTDIKAIINAVNARATKNGQAVVDLKIEIRGIEHLKHIVERIKKIKDVLDVRRVTPHCH